MRRIINHKAILISLLMGWLFMGPSDAFSTEFKEGVHYTEFDNGSAVKSRGVVEYFSFSCPGCFAFESRLAKIIESNPTITFERVHTPFGGRAAKYSQKVFVLLKLLNRQDQFNNVFSRIHLLNKGFNSDDDILVFFEQLGFDKKEVRANIDSFTADSLRRKMNKRVSRNKVFSVPAIVVNDQYKLNLGELKSEAELNELIRYLIHL